MLLQFQNLGDHSTCARLFSRLPFAPPCTPFCEHAQTQLDTQALQFVLLENPCVKETIKKRGKDKLPEAARLRRQGRAGDGKQVCD